MAQIKIRNFPEEKILTLDAMARKENLSRETFLRLRIEKICDEEIYFEREKKFKKIVNSVTEIISRNSEILSKIMEEMNGNYRN
ncbi:MAG: hypothetical protein LBV19_05285 [Streptococcaceae bacterium]|nr:hypothetical protein [Streptococcaceae bacterium]